MTINLGLPEKFKNLTELGSGGMGAVYKATDSILDKTVAIKVLKDNVNASSTQLQRFQQEAKASGKLQHSNIVTTLDFGITDNGCPFLVMDYIEGSPLNEFIAFQNRLSVEESLFILIQVCQPWISLTIKV